MHARMRLDSNRSTCHAVEHPRWKLQAAACCIAVTATPHDIAARLLDHLMNVDNASSPRMESVKYLALFAPVGVPAPRCSITGGRIVRLDNVRPAHRRHLRLIEALKLERSLQYRCLEASITSISTPHDVPDLILAPYRERGPTISAVAAEPYQTRCGPSPRKSKFRSPDIAPLCA
jgi:hypothetical protein